MNQLALLLNNTLQSVFQALSHGLSIDDNISGTVKDVTLSVDSSGTPTQTSALTLRNTAQVRGTIVISAVNQVNSNSYPLSGVIVSGAQNGTLYTINNVSGLQPNTKYTIRVWALQTS